VELLQRGCVVVVAGVHHGAVFGRQELVQRVLVKGTGLAVHADEESLVAERLHVLGVVLRHELGHLGDALLALQEVLQVHGAVQHLVQVLDVRQPLGIGQAQELLVQRFVRHQHLVRCHVVVAAGWYRQRCCRRCDLCR